MLVRIFRKNLFLPLPVTYHEMSQGIVFERGNN